MGRSSPGCCASSECAALSALRFVAVGGGGYGVADHLIMCCASSERAALRYHFLMLFANADLVSPPASCHACACRAWISPGSGATPLRNRGGRWVIIPVCGRQPRPPSPFPQRSPQITAGGPMAGTVRRVGSHAAQAAAHMSTTGISPSRASGSLHFCPSLPTATADMDMLETVSRWLCKGGCWRVARPPGHERRLRRRAATRQLTRLARAPTSKADVWTLDFRLQFYAHSGHATAG